MEDEDGLGDLLDEEGLGDMEGNGGSANEDKEIFAARSSFRLGGLFS